MGKSLIITTGGGTDIEEGSPNARPDVILQGYSLFVGPDDDPVVGSMPTQYATPTTYTMGVGSSLTLAKGYYTGGLTCSAKPLKDFTSATATADQITNAKTGWRNGAKQTGSMPWIGAGGATLSANGTHTISKGQYDGKGKVAQSLSTQAATNITPGTAQKTVIAANKWTTGAQTVLGNANLIAGNIKKNVTIFGVKGTFAVDPASALVGGVSPSGVNVVGACGMTYGRTSSSNSGHSSRMKTYWQQYCRFPPVIQSGALRMFTWHADGTDARWCWTSLGCGSKADGGTDRYGNPSYTTLPLGAFTAKLSVPTLNANHGFEIQIDYLKWNTSKAENTSPTGDTVGFRPFVQVNAKLKDGVSWLPLVNAYSPIFYYAYGGDAIAANQIQRQNVAFTIKFSEKPYSGNIAKYNSDADRTNFAVMLGHHPLHLWKKTGKVPASGVFDSWFWVKNLFIRVK